MGCRVGPHWEPTVRKIVTVSKCEIDLESSSVRKKVPKGSPGKPVCNEAGRPVDVGALAAACGKLARTTTLPKTPLKRFNMLVFAAEGGLAKSSFANLQTWCTYGTLTVSTCMLPLKLSW